jgi:serine/threonine-protein kinase HipA
MNRCPITYSFCDDKLYSAQGLKLLSPKLKDLEKLDFSAEELRAEAMLRGSKMSIQGIQPKLSAVLNVSGNRFEIIDKGGKYILKPQHHIFPELPQNEDLTMRLAETIGIEVPFHGLIYSKDDSLTYFVRRFDRKGHKEKIAVEDFAQLAGMSRETKYNYSMEKLVKLIDEYCTFPAIEKAKLFKLVIFNFLVGNEDMHLKNYSIIVRNGKIELSPAYDLLNSTIVLTGDIEEIALSLKGKKSNLSQEFLISYFGQERCGLPDKIIKRTIAAFQNVLPSWFDLLEASFLSTKMKEKYEALLRKRIEILGIQNLRFEP